jgi:hypothetical protein
MSVKSFDNLLELIKEEMKADANPVLRISTRTKRAFNARHLNLAL